VGRFIVLHIPHIVPVLVAFAFLGRLALAVADQPPVHLDESAVDQWRIARAERQHARRVRRSTSRIGLIALVPLLAATGSGLLLYSFALNDERPSAAFGWAHSIVSVVALVLVGWKLWDGGLERVRRGLDLHRALIEGASLLLAALGIPLLVTGAWLLAEPSDSSFASNVHLVASVWWMALFGVHLFRYLGRAVDAALRDGGNE
jgi:Ca2+/H+ antiporter